MRTLTTLVLFILVSPCFANNIQVTNVSVTGQNTVDNFTMVEFDISWENSWRLIGGANNWDAAWIFVKYRIGAGPWTHARLNNTGHVSCAGTTVDAGLFSPGQSFNPTTNPGIGVFLYRSGLGSGTLNCQNVQLRWNYGANNLTDSEQIDIKVFAIEMVFVPEASFSIGSGGSEVAAFHKYPNATDPYTVLSENEITVSATANNLYYLGGAFEGDAQGPIPATFPKGYKAFYAMKYEISQQGYVDFLNVLSRTQQISRVRSTITGLSVTNQYVMSNTSTVTFRNGIWSFSTIPSQPAPLIFFSNLNANQTGNEPTDGQSIAANYLSPEDVWSYLDWAGLRPMTELEYEKMSRGPLTPVPNEFAWGNTYFRAVQTITNPGAINEGVTDDFSNSNQPAGPLRCGVFARTGTDRTYSGSGYYGVMDCTGNVWERTVSVGTPGGRNYTGNHGNGELNNSGNANEGSWPASSTTGIGMRGGSFTSAFPISNRSNGAIGLIDPQREGGRGVRTTP